MILPPPGSSFRWQQTAAGAALVCGPLERFATHFFTTRAWQLGEHRAGVSDDAAWAEVAAAMNAPLGVARLRQVHGRDVVIAKSGDTGAIAEGDILIADQPGMAIAVQAADCVPLLLVDPVKRVVASAHAGWRGMVAGVPRVTIAALEREFGCRPEDLIVAAGPSIGACCYEVGPDVRSAFHNAGWDSDIVDACFHETPHGTAANPSMALAPPRAQHWFFDGWAWMRGRLEAAGIAADRIHFADLCTASHPDVFPSFRRDGARAGRIVGVIQLTEKPGRAEQGGSGLQAG